jgi:hypothetical protein
MLTLTPEDALARYRGTLETMEPDKVRRLGEGWSQALLSFYFKEDQTRAAFSCRDTLLPMLRHDNRVLSKASIAQFLDSIALDASASDIALQIHDAYSESKSRG